VGALAEIDKHLNPSRLVIVTKDEEDVLQTQKGSKVDVVPLWKWLME
jgi:predicted AAA+ superfamily ATPase